MYRLSHNVREFAIFGNRHQGAHLAEISEFFALLVRRGFQVAVDRRFYNYLLSENVTIPQVCYASDELPVSAEALVSIGGDGTILRALQWAGTRQIPVLGMNTGTLGFLSPYRLHEASELLDELGAGFLKVEKRGVLQVSGECVPAHIFPYAVNEVAVLKDETSSMITVQAVLDGYFLADYRADGLLIATPTGSTAYNLSVGGPIVQPTVDCRIISPVAPHSLTMRPLVVDADSPVELLTTSRAHNYRVSLDGRSFVMKCGTRICVRSAPFKAILLRRRHDNFASILRQKLYWAQNY